MALPGSLRGSRSGESVEYAVTERSRRSDPTNNKILTTKDMNKETTESTQQESRVVKLRTIVLVRVERV